MSRHETESLWAHAGGELPAADAARVSAHLKECAGCALRLDEVRAARELTAQPQVPPLPAASWARIDQGVAAAARQALARPRWQAWLFGAPGLATAALAAAAVLLFVLWPARAPGPHPDGLAVGPGPATGALPGPGLPGASGLAPEPSRPLEPPVALAQVRVARARGASTVILGQQAPLGADQKLEPGTTVATEAKGVAWLDLPEGSRAGVLGDSRLVVVQVDPKAVSLELVQGSLVVAATHVEGRTFEVHAGEVDVRVVGTRFLVERTAGQVVVAVSEGAVQVAAGERLYALPAGRKLVVDQGKPVEAKLGPKDEDELSLLSPLPPRPGPRAPSPSVAAPRPDEGWAAFDAGAPASASGADAGPTHPSDAGFGRPDDEYAAYPGRSAVSAPPPPPDLASDAGAVAPRAEPADAGAATASEPPIGMWAVPAGAEPVDGGQPSLVQRLLAAEIDAPFPPLGMSMEEHRARQLGRLADKNLCTRALARVDAWLEAYPEDGTPARAQLRRQVRFTQARCLAKLGRPDEAEKIRRETR